MAKKKAEQFDGETGLRVEPEAEVQSGPSAEYLRAVLQRIADGRRCGCLGDHDAEVFDCPKTIAKAALETP